MQIYLCIDDTDNIDSKGTGSIAGEIASFIEEKGWGKTQAITRHQLFVHPDIPYTSHNSSMCFIVALTGDYLDEVITSAINVLETESAEGSDPGLCVFVPETLTQHQHQQIIEFGLKAKREVLTKLDAYQLAESLSLHLSEHGGDGQGVIGALAGVGLRLSGNDGRFKGHHRMNEEKESFTVKEILENTSIDMVRTEAGLMLNDTEEVVLEVKFKSVFLDHKSVLLVESLEKDGAFYWQPCSGSKLKKY